ncbi:MAG: dUTP diphosphatase [Spirochaetes bacterium]|nr:dUTP diphosphatase [Spirochaetota bacterium]
MNSKPVVLVKKLKENALIPHYKSLMAAGADIYACLDQAVDLQAHERVIIPSGIAIELPPGYEAQVRPRSGLAHTHGVTCLNSPGTVDSDYRGEVCVILINHGNTSFRIENGDRIAQLVVAPVSTAEFCVVEDLTSTDRGANGFGSTGLR